MTPAETLARLTERLHHADIAASPERIVQEERNGQSFLLSQDVLPRRINGGTQAQLARFGLTFGADVDDLFVACVLPQGWTKRAGAWDTHNDLFDAQDRHRAFLYFKAVFYDRQAYMSLHQRFNVHLYGPGRDQDHRRATITDGGKVLLELGEWNRMGDDFRETSSALHAQGVAWLNARYPQWNNVLAYWD